MSILKRIGTFLLVLLLLVPAISAEDDAIRLSAVLFNDSLDDDTLNGLGHFPKLGDDSILATLLERLDTQHVGSFCALQVDLSSTPLHRIEAARISNGSVPSPVGRAPPAV